MVAPIMTLNHIPSRKENRVFLRSNRRCNFLFTTTAMNFTPQTYTASKRLEHTYISIQNQDALEELNLHRQQFINPG